MKRNLMLFVSLYVLSFTLPVAAETSQKQNKLNYLENYQSWTSIAEEGETTITDNDVKPKVRVKIKTQTVDIGKYDSNGAFVRHEDNQSCSYTRYPCSVVKNMDITVNEKRLFPHPSVYADLADLNRGKVFIETNNMVLILTGGDASTGYCVKIDFNNK